MLSLLISRKNGTILIELEQTNIETERLFMNIDINELTRIYTKANLEMSDIYEVSIPAGFQTVGGTTATDVCGFVIPIKGKAKFKIDNHSYELKPGVILHAGAGILLDKEVVGNTEWKYILLHYKEMGDSKIKAALEVMNFVLPIENSGSIELEILLQKLIKLSDKRSTMDRFKMKTLLYAVIDLILQYALQATIDSKEESIDHILEFIHSNMYQNLSVAQLADRINMDSKQFHYLFHKEMGVCPKKYLIQCKIEQAKKLLMDVNYSITNVANMVGYEDPLHFSRIFKKNTGYSPSAFRHNFEKNPWRI